MKHIVFGIEMIGIFGAVIAFALWDLWRMERDAAKRREAPPSEDTDPG
ncbi:MAG: hypothetical protein AAGH87_03940 [Pseudomonadota bacterium]